MLFLGDSLVCILALPRARSQDSKMLVQVRRVAAWLLSRLVSGAFRGALRWIPSKWNTADDPSRLAKGFAIAGGDAAAALPLFLKAAQGSRSPAIDAHIDTQFLPVSSRRSFATSPGVASETRAHQAEPNATQAQQDDMLSCCTDHTFSSTDSFGSDRDMFWRDLPAPNGAEKTTSPHGPSLRFLSSARQLFRTLGQQATALKAPRQAC